MVTKSFICFPCQLPRSIVAKATRVSSRGNSGVKRSVIPTVLFRYIVTPEQYLSIYTDVKWLFPVTAVPKLFGAPIYCSLKIQHKMFKLCIFSSSIAISPHSLSIPHTLPVCHYSSPLPSFPFFTLKILNKVWYETSFTVKRTPDCPENLMHYSSPLPAVPIPCPATQYATPDHARFSMISECLCYPIMRRDRLTYTVGN
jgi:hypothetical protein